MKRLLSIPPIVFQICITWFVLLMISILFFRTGYSYHFHLVAGLGYERHPILFGSVPVLISIGICLIAGLPIRVFPRVYEWWTRRPFLNLLGLLAALYLIFIYPIFFSGTWYVSDIVLARTEEHGGLGKLLLGWFLLAFSLLHLYPVSFARKKPDHAV